MRLVVDQFSCIKGFHFVMQLSVMQRNNKIVNVYKRFVISSCQDLVYVRLTVWVIKVFPLISIDKLNIELLDVLLIMPLSIPRTAGNQRSKRPKTRPLAYVSEINLLPQRRNRPLRCGDESILIKLTDNDCYTRLHCVSPLSEYDVNCTQIELLYKEHRRQISIIVK